MRDQATAKELEEFARDIVETVKVVGEMEPDKDCGVSIEMDERMVKRNIEEAAEHLENFMKKDGAKPPLAILFDTSRALEGVARVMAFGAEKYDRKNWAKVDDTERYISAALRHIAAHCSGERFDQESGLDHLDHAITSLLFVSELIKRD